MSESYPITLQQNTSSYTELNGQRTFKINLKYFLYPDGSSGNQQFKSRYGNNINVTAFAQFTSVDNVSLNVSQQGFQVNYGTGNRTINFDVSDNNFLNYDIVRVQVFILTQSGTSVSNKLGLQKDLVVENIGTVPNPVQISVGVSDNLAVINWSGEDNILQYHIVVKNNNTGQTIQEFNVSGTKTNATIENLKSDTNYSVYIIAINQTGNSQETSSTFTTLETTTPVIIPDGFHKMPDGSIMANSEMYNFIIESDGLVRIFRIGAAQYTEIKIQPDSVQSIIDRNIGRLLTPEERAIPYPRITPTPTPEPTFCVNVYSIRDSGSVYSTSYPEITAAKVAELEKTQFVLSCSATTVPTEKQVQDFYGFTPVPPQVDTTINSTMISQSIGSFILKDGRITGEVLYIANQSFNPFYYDKQITSLIQIKSKSGVVIAIKSNNLNFTETERDERITIDESAGNFKELLIDFFVWDSPLSQIIFSETKQIQIVDETDVAPADPFDPQPPVTTCPAGYHKDFSGKCVADDPIGEIPKDRLIETLKGFLFGTVALSLLARKY